MLLHELFAKKQETLDQSLTDDVAFFIDNDDDLHKEYFLPAVDILKRKKLIDRDEIDEIYPEFKILVDNGCKKYHEQFKVVPKPEELFTQNFKEEVAKIIAKKHLRHIKDGQYEPKET